MSCCPHVNNYHQLNNSVNGTNEQACPCMSSPRRNVIRQTFPIACRHACTVPMAAVGMLSHHAKKGTFTHPFLPLGGGYYCGKARGPLGESWVGRKRGRVMTRSLNVSDTEHAISRVRRRHEALQTFRGPSKVRNLMQNCLAYRFDSWPPSCPTRTVQCRDKIRINTAITYTMKGSLRLTEAINQPEVLASIDASAEIQGEADQSLVGCENVSSNIPISLLTKAGIRILL